MQPVNTKHLLTIECLEFYFLYMDHDERQAYKKAVQRKENFHHTKAQFGKWHQRALKVIKKRRTVFSVN